MQGVVDLIPCGDRGGDVYWSSIPAADRGKPDIHGKCVCTAAAQPPFFTRERIKHIFIVESRIVFDAITAFVPGIEEGGCEQEVVAMVKEAFNGQFHSFVCARSFIDEADFVGETEIGAGVQHGKAAGCSFHRDIEKILVVQFGLEPPFGQEAPFIACDEMLSAGESQFSVGGVADLFGLVEGLVIHGQRLYLAMKAITKRDRLAGGELIYEGDPWLKGGVLLELHAVQAGHDAELFAKAVFELTEILQQEGGAIIVAYRIEGSCGGAGRLVEDLDVEAEGFAGCADAIREPAVDLSVEIGREAVGAGAVVRSILKPAVLVGGHRIGIAVLIIVVQGVGIGDYGSQISAVVQVQCVFDAEVGEIAFVVAVLVGLAIEIRRVYFAADERDVAESAHSEEGPPACRSPARGEVEGPILVIGNGLGADIDADRGGDLGGAVTVAGEIGGAVILVIERAFHGRLDSAEHIELDGLLMFAAVAAAEVDIEYRCDHVAVFRGEGAGEEIGGFQHIGIEGRDGAAGRAQGGEVIGAWSGAAFDAPENACRGVTANDDIVAGIAVGCHAGVVADEF